MIAGTPAKVYYLGKGMEDGGIAVGVMLAAPSREALLDAHRAVIVGLQAAGLADVAFALARGGECCSR